MISVPLGKHRIAGYTTASNANMEVRTCKHMNCDKKKINIFILKLINYNGRNVIDVIDLINVMDVK